MNPLLIDTHAHLDDQKFRDDLPAVLERARLAGIIHVLTIGTTAANSQQNVELSRKYSLLSAAVGLHPNTLTQEPHDAWDAICELAAQEGVRALGETGLDRHWDDTPFPKQEDFFARHLELGRKNQLPIVIHCREAQADILRMLRVDFDRHGPIRGVMHSFTGDQATAEACLSMGLHLSFAGMLTYKNAQELREVAAGVPENRLLVETDSPYLAPVPLRGARNEPANVVHTARALADVRGVSLDTLAISLTANAQKLFGLTN